MFAACANAVAVEAGTLDRAWGLIGAWNCQTAGGGSATMTFTRQSDGSITMRNVASAGTTGEIDEAFWLITPAQYWSWTATQPARPDFKEAATAGMWTAQKWFFDGTVTARPHRHDTETHRIRIVYTWISDASFERELETYENGAWRTSSSSVCRRT